VSLTFVRLEQVSPFTNNLAGLLAGSGTVEDLTFNHARDRAPDWSPDGTRLAFSRDDVIFVVNADGTGLRSFAITGGTNPAWSPDGTKIAYDNGGSVLVFDPDGSAGETFVSSGIQPAWSPDGTKIAHEVDVGAAESDVFVVNADGTGRVNLTNRSQLVDREPTWSPDGSQIAFRRLDRTENVGYDLWVMDADGGNQTRLVSLSGPQLNPRWLPDDRILFDSGRGIMALEPGGAVTSLTNEPGFIHFDPAWRSRP
jgi:Tol biopolymer transport system component